MADAYRPYVRWDAAVRLTTCADVAKLKPVSDDRFIRTRNKGHSPSMGPAEKRMNTEFVILRIIHVVFGMFWAGSAVFIATILEPRLRALGPAV